MRGHQRTSKLSYADLKRSGAIGAAQARYLVVIAGSEEGMTHKEATSAVLLSYGVKYPDRNGRIAELVERGFVAAVGEKRCSVTRKIVTVYGFTGRTEPLPSRQEWVKCEACDGKGHHLKTVYENPQQQGDLFQ